MFEYRDILELSSDYQSCHEAMRNIRRYLTQNITLDRIQNVLDLGLEGRIKTILETPGYDELKVAFFFFFHFTLDVNKAAV